MATPPPYETSIPGVGTYGQAVNQANLAYKNAVTRLNAKRQGTLGQFGYAGDINAEDGTLSNLHVDPNAKFGAYQEMLRQGNQAGLASRDQLIERHISGRGGLGAQSEDLLKEDFGRSSNALGQALGGALGDTQDQLNTAAYDKNSALYLAEQQAIDAASHNPANLGGGAPPVTPAGPGSSDRRQTSGGGTIDPWAVNITGSTDRTKGLKDPWQINNLQKPKPKAKSTKILKKGRVVS